MNANDRNSESKVKDSVKLFLEAAVSAAVNSLSEGCPSGQLKIESGKSRVIWLNLFVNDSKSQFRRFVAETNDIDDLVGIQPSFRFASNSCPELKSAMVGYLCRKLADAESVSAVVFRRSAGGDLPRLEGSSDKGAFVGEQPVVRWEPMGPCGFGC